MWGKQVPVVVCVLGLGKGAAARVQNVNEMLKVVLSLERAVCAALV